MTEPVYVAQTAEPEHLADKASQDAWFRDRFNEAMKRGGLRSRRTRTPEALLIEVWVPPMPWDRGPRRWLEASNDT